MNDLYILFPISIHVPNVGNDGSSIGTALIGRYFNPRSQCRERPRYYLQKYISEHFNPRSQCRERLNKFVKISTYLNFNPRSQCRERQQTYPNINLKQHYICNILRFSFNIFSSLIYIVIQYSIFVQLFWCESPGIFMYTSYSHYQIAI